MLKSMLKKKRREERPSEGLNGFKIFLLGHYLMRLPLMLIARDRQADRQRRRPECPCLRSFGLGSRLFSSGRLSFLHFSFWRPLHVNSSSRSGQCYVQ